MIEDNSTDESSAPAHPPGTPGGTGQAPFIPDHQLLKRIGWGSYGEVWLARNIMGEFRAAKVVYRKSFKDRRPFERELSGIRKFEPISRSHEGFIHVLQVGIDKDDGYFYYVMELGDDELSGPEIRPENYSPKTLAKCISQHKSLPLPECIKLGLALSLALSELHKHGLVHRDVKPSNIVFVNGVPKLADIGLVAEVNEAQSYVGTEGFIPPEGPGGAQADIYSLGKTLYEVSTGKDRNDFPELPTLLADYPNLGGFLELNEVILHACKNDLKARYQSAWDMHADLLVLATGKSVKRLRVLEHRLSSLKRAAGISLLGLALLAAISHQVYREWKAVMEARQRQVGANLAYGKRALDSGDLMGSLPYFADALRLDSGNPDQMNTHRLRIGSILAQCPKLTHVWSEGIRINSGEFSPNGKRVLAAESHGDLKIYELESGKTASHAFAGSNWLWNASFSPDSRLVVTANGDGSAHVLDSGDLHEICCLSYSSTGLDSARFSPDGLRIVTASRGGFVRIWNLRTRSVELSLTDEKRVRYADFSRDGRMVVTASEDSKACLWDAADGRLLKEFPHESWVYYAAFSPDNKRVITAGADHKARVWDVETGRRIMPDLNHGDGVESAEYSSDGRMIVTACLDGTARLWQADTLQPLAMNPILRNGDRESHAAISPDGRQILTTGMDGTIRIWDLAGRAVLPGPAPDSISENGNRYFSESNNTIEVRDITSGKPVGPLILSGVSFEKAQLSQDGRCIVSMAKGEKPGEQIIQIWSAATGKAAGPAFAISSSISHAVLGADGKHLAMFGGNEWQSWDVLTGTAFSRLLHIEQSIDSAFFNPDCSRFATAGGKMVQIWDSGTGLPCFGPLTFSNLVHSAEFSPDGSRTVGCCWDSGFTKCYAQVWSAATGLPIGPRLMHGDGVLCASFSPDGRRVVTASEDFTAVVWDTASGKPLFPPVQHDEKVQTAYFSPDGRWFVTASYDKTARVWNAETGDPLTPPLQHLGIVDKAVFLPDGHRILTRERNGPPRIWDLTLDERPVDDLILLSRLLAGSTETRFGQPALRQSESLEVVWRRLHRKYPSAFETSAEEIENWHEFQAELCETQGQRMEAEFHRKHELALRAGVKSISGHAGNANHPHDSGSESR